MAVYLIPSRTCRVLFVALLFLSVNVCEVSSQTSTDAIAPVRVGDEVEVQSGSKWYSGTVSAFSGGSVTVDYKWGTIPRSDDFPLPRVRFPRGEGHWMIWKDKSSKFSIEARYISRTEDKVTLRKSDGNDVAIPIEMLSSPLRKQVLRIPVTGNENMIDGANPVRVGDKIEVKSYSSWYPGVVTEVLPGEVDVSYKRNSFDYEGRFKLTDIRFPNGEGRWRKWTDASGSFELIARYISRTQDTVTIRKEDGSDLTIPIEKLASDLQRLLAQTPVTGDENKVDGANPVRVGDEIQVKYWFRWYDAVVIKVLPGEVDATFKYSRSERTERIKLSDTRFRNGEGRWREWSDSSGEFKLIGRFISRDQTHVTIRTEDDSDLRVEINRLNAQLRRLLAETPIITPRPRNFDFREAGRQITIDKNVGAMDSLTLSVASIPTPRMPTGGNGFPIPNSDAISAAVPIGGQTGMVAVGAYKSNSTRYGGQTKLYWASTASPSVVDGPVFLDDERVVDYSPEGTRILNVQVGGYYGTPVRFCTYRIAAGESSAKPEASWEIPEASSSYGRGSNYQAKLIGSKHLLLANNQSVSLYDMGSREIVYSIAGVHESRFYLHPGQQHFAVMDSSGGLALFALATGDQIAYQPGGRTWGTGAGFSQDGNYFLGVNSSNINVWNLSSGGPPKTLRRGGLNVGPGTPISLLSGGWISAGSQIYSTGLKLVVWNYVGSGVKIWEREMLGRQMLIAATATVGGKPHALVGAATIPHEDAVELMKKVDPESIVMLKPGAGIRLQASGNSKILSGMRRAVAVAGFREDPNSDVIMTGSAGPGETENRKYQVTSFGFGGGSGIEEHSVTPWIQKVEIRHNDQYAWGTQMGGVPMFVSVGKDSSLGQELQKSSQANYSLFESLELPRIALPKISEGSWYDANHAQWFR